MLELNKLHLMDCMEGMKTFPDNYFDVCITDPPYNVKFQYNSYNDNLEYIEYKNWCLSWLVELQRITSGLISISCGTKNIGMWYEIQKPIWMSAWHKPAAMGGSPLGICNWEPLLIYGKPQKKSTDVITAPIISSNEMDFHPCPKPIKWAEAQLSYYGIGGKLIDPFMGSGTTAIAAMKYNYDWIGFEIDEDYHKAASERIEIHKKRPKPFFTDVELADKNIKQKGFFDDNKP